MVRHQNGYLLRLVYHKFHLWITFFLLIYINSQPYVDDTSLFSALHESNISANELICKKKCELAYGWKMSFNPDLNRRAQEVIFSRKLNKLYHLKNVFNSAPVAWADWQKHWEKYLDKAPDFNLHIKKKYPRQWREQMSFWNSAKLFPGINLIQYINHLWDLS